MADGSARWIAKPSITNQATGICIFDRVSQLEAALHANEDLREWVLQRYAILIHLLLLSMKVKTSTGACALVWYWPTAQAMS